MSENTNQNNGANVAAGKPAVTGALYWAPSGTTLPTDAKTPLAAAFVCLGYISDEGLKNHTERTRNEIKAWGGDTVLVLEEETSDTFTYKLIECRNVNALKHVYGSDNVTEDGGKIAIDVTQVPVPEEGVMVVEQLLRTAMKRIVIPRAVVKEVGEISYEDTDAVGYDTTAICLPKIIDGKKIYHREYIEEPDATATGD